MDPSTVSVKHLNGDLAAKQGGEGKGKKYWSAVATLAEAASRGGGSTLVLADKNLVPHPFNNLESAASTVSAAGAATVAVLPVCRIDAAAIPAAAGGGNLSGTDEPMTDVDGTTAAGQPLSLARSLEADLPPLPFPLELIALAVLRVLGRRNHEGNLDERLGHAACVVLSFVMMFRNMSRATLVDRLRDRFTQVVELEVMTVNAAQQVRVLIRAPRYVWVQQ